MVELEFVQYDDRIHRQQFFDLNVEYLQYLRNLSIQKQGTSTLPANPRAYVESVFSKFTSIMPPEGIIIIAMYGKRVVGMGALRKLEDGVGEVKRMYIQPEFQGHGYGKMMLKILEGKAKEFGYSILRLDTGVILEAAVHVYRKAGFFERSKYSGTESDGGPGYLYMEKKL